MNLYWNTSWTSEFASEVVVSMLFFQPGRHAGEAGDVAKICQDAAAPVPTQRACMTELVGTHPGLVPILADRIRQAIDSPPLALQHGF